MRRVSTLVLMLLLGSFEAAALTGTVRNAAGDPLEAVAVSFAGIDTVLYTGADGAFSLVRSAVSQPRLTLRSQAGVQLHETGLVVSLPSAQLVRVSLTDLAGRRQVLFDGRLDRGVHLVGSTEIAALSNGVYILHAMLGRERVVCRALTLSGLRLAESATTAVRNGALSKAAAGEAIDTVRFSLAGYIDVTRSIASYDENLGTIVMTPDIYTGEWHGFTRCDIDTLLPNFVNILFRAYDSLGRGISNLDTSRIVVLEDEQPITSESELIIEKASAFSDTIRTVMLLDRSSSVADNLDDIKDAAKVMVRSIAPHQQMAIYTFSETNDLVVDFTDDTTALLNAIDIIPLGYASTNLYGALIDAFGRIENYASVADRTIMYGNVVLFTDGRDTQGSHSLNEVLSAQGSKQVFALGLGAELDTTALRAIAGDFVYTTTDVHELAGLFAVIQQDITNTANSYYWAHYRSPKRGNTVHTLAMRLEGNSNSGPDASITGTFNSALFQAGWAPTAESLSIVLDTSGTRLLGRYVYRDLDGEIEGASRYRWYVNGTMVDSGSIELAASLVSTGDTVVFQVQPVSLFGSPKEGVWAACTVKVGAPRANNLSVVLNATKDTLVGSYTYSDTDPEGQSIVEWFVADTVRVGDGTRLPVVVFEQFAGLTATTHLTLAVTPVASSGIPTIGETQRRVLAVGTFLPAPTANEVAITLNADADSVVGSYTYAHADQVPEGASIIRWFRNGVPLAPAGLTIPATLFAFGDVVGFSVTPVAVSGMIEQGVTVEAPSRVMGAVTGYRTYRQEFNQRATGGVAAGTGGFVITGYQYTSTPTKSPYAVRIDERGDTIWTRSYRASALTNGKATAIAGADAGHIIVGSREDARCFGFRIDEQGDTLWTKDYGRGEACGIIAAENGFLIVGTDVHLENGSVSYHVRAIKIDGNGTIVWDRVYTGENIEEGFSVAKGTGGYVIVGASRPPTSTDTRYLCIKIDDNGDTVWTRTYGPVVTYEAHMAAANGGYIYISGRLIAKIDEEGNTVWTREYGEAHNQSIIRTPSGYLISGFISSPQTGSDICLTSVNEYGDSLWTRTHKKLDNQWDCRSAAGADNCLLVAGTSDHPISDYDFLAMKIDANGEITAFGRTLQ